MNLEVTFDYSQRTPAHAAFRAILFGDDQIALRTMLTTHGLAAITEISDPLGLIESIREYERSRRIVRGNSYEDEESEALDLDRECPPWSPDERFILQTEVTIAAAVARRAGFIAVAEKLESSECLDRIRPIPRPVIFAGDNNTIRAHTLFEGGQVFVDRMFISFEPFASILFIFHEFDHLCDKALTETCPQSVIDQSEFETFSRQLQFAEVLEAMYCRAHGAEIAEAFIKPLFMHEKRMMEEKIEFFRQRLQQPMIDLSGAAFSIRFLG